VKADEILQDYFDCGYPAVAVETLEEKRLLQECKSRHLGERIFSIAAVGGLLNESGNTSIVADGQANFPKAFQFMTKQEESILMVYDFQYMVHAPTSYRPLLQVLDACKAKGTMIVLVAPVWKMPEELKHVIPVIQTDLPTSEELEVPLDAILKSTEGRTITPSHRRSLLEASRGLIIEQAENVFALSSRKDFSRLIVEAEKMKLVKSEYMSVEKPKDPSLLAGLGELKRYIMEEVLTSKDDIQLQVRGIALIGVPGTGKSLSARVIAALLGRPLVRFDISAAKGSLVGQSEANMRKALATADAISPCVLWLDEVEKAVGGHSSSSHTDGGTTLSMVGTLLTWMQEHTTSVLTVATCNDHLKLPTEMLRAGRFDEKFFLDLPSRKEREEVAKVHLTILSCDLNWADTIAEMCDDFTPAEIEQLIKSAARRTGRKLELRMIERCFNEIKPIAKTTQIQQLREWASTNLRRANDAQETASGRKVRGN
jgi:hypothetical protein